MVIELMGILEDWNNGIVGIESIGILEEWNNGIVEKTRAGP